MKKKFFIAIAVLAGLAVVAVGALVAINLLHGKEPDNYGIPMGVDPYVINDGIFLDEDTYSLFTDDAHIVSSNEFPFPYIDNEIVITFCEGTTEDDVRELIQEYNGTIIGKIGVMYRYEIRFNRIYSFEELTQIIEELNSNAIVEKAYYNLIFPDSIGDVEWADRKWINDWGDAYPKGKNWGVEAIQADKAWKYREDMTPINVGIYDLSFQYGHEDLDFIEAPQGFYQVQYDNDSHGTHVSGIVAATHNSIGIAGVAPRVNLYGASEKGVKKVGIKISPRMIALSYLIDTQKCKVINISLAVPLYEFAYNRNKDVEEAMNYVSNEISSYLLILLKNGNDFVICKSAGNQGEFDYKKVTNDDYRYSTIPDGIGYKQDPKGKLCGIDGATNLYSLITEPEIKARIITVGSIENGKKGNYKITPTSQVGKGVDILAPGEKIHSTIRTNKYGKLSGTSMASPHVAGVAAMMFAVNPNLSGEEVKSIILDTATGNYPHAHGAHKLVNALKAVEEAHRRKEEYQSTLPPVPPVEPDFSSVEGTWYQVRGPVNNELTITNQTSDGFHLEAMCIYYKNDIDCFPGSFDGDFKFTSANIAVFKGFAYEGATNIATITISFRNDKMEVKVEGNGGDSSLLGFGAKAFMSGEYSRTVPTNGEETTSIASSMPAPITETHPLIGTWECSDRNAPFKAIDIHRHIMGLGPDFDFSFPGSNINANLAIYIENNYITFACTYNPDRMELPIMGSVEFLFSVYGDILILQTSDTGYKYTYTRIKDGEATTEPTKPISRPESNGEWDYIKAECGDGYYFVRKEVNTYSSYENQYGIIDSNGKFISELSSTMFGKVQNLQVRHIGEGIFAFFNTGNFSIRWDDGSGTYPKYYGQGASNDYHIFNVNTNRFIYEEAIYGNSQTIGVFKNGFALYAERGNIYKMDTTGRLYDLKIPSLSFGPLSEGLFYADNGLYDMNGNLKVDLSDYNIVGYEYLVKDGKFYFEFKNPGGTRYFAEVDLKGKLLYTPEKVR